MLYPQHFIDELKNRADLVRIIEPYAPLKKKGANWMGCCPFHQEKTPSFSVNPSKGFYKCFGCGKGGTAFNFVMEMEGLNFPEAIKRVAEISGIPLPEPIDDAKYEQTKKRRQEQKAIADQVIELNSYALEFWENYLQENNPQAKAAREYLEKRELSIETIKAFRIGYSPDSWDALMSHLKSKGADEKLIEQSGLVSINEEKNRVYDRFRGRVMFPVLNVDGKPVAFGARILAQGEPKYLNSPETPAYVKGHNLYGLFQNKADIKAKKFAILVEGYLDLIALYQFGIRNVVASLGTALTHEQAKLLGKFSRKVVVNYDGDAAGARAAKKAFKILLYNGFEIKVLFLPDGLDPDDFVRKNGVKLFNTLRGNALPIYDFLFNRIPQEYNIMNKQDRQAFIEEVLPICSAFKPSSSDGYGKVHQRQLFDELMQHMGIFDVKVIRDWWEQVKIQALAYKKEDDADNRKLSKANRAFYIKPTLAELKLLKILIHDEEVRKIILPQLEETDYISLATAEIFVSLLNFHKTGEELTYETLRLISEDDEILQELIFDLWISESLREPDEVIDEVLIEAESCLAALRTMAINRRIVEISQELALAEQSGDMGLRDLLVNEQINLARLKFELERANFSEERY